MIHFAGIWLVMTVGSVVPAHLSFNVTRNGVGAIALATLVLGALSSSLRPLYSAFFDALKLYSFALFSLGLNPITAWLTSRLADGFHWREGLTNALINPV